MAEKNPKKEKIKIAIREPRKPKPGIFDELGKGRQQNVKHPFSEIVNFPSDVTEITHPTHPIPSYDSPSDPIQPVQGETVKKPVSPVSDFQKVPNSITRNGIPNKLFKGTSKNTYDALYLKTRGAIKPVRTIKATKRELMKWIGISHVTIFKHLKHLESVGLIAIEQQMGSHNGSIYEVFIPEELKPIQPDLSYPILTHTTHPILSYPILSYKLGWEAYNNVVWDRMGNQTENKDTYESSKTSLKTNTKNDDEAFVTMHEVFRQMGKGKQASWRELAELLKSEFETASSRTGSVSDAPAFLAEHLRRRLSAKPPRTEKAKPFEPGKDEPIIEAEIFTPEPLTEEGREVVLNNLRRMPREAANGYEDHYTAEDWEWLVEKLG